MNKNNKTLKDGIIKILRFAICPISCTNKKVHREKVVNDILNLFQLQQPKGECQHKWDDVVCIGITGKIMCNECEETLLSTKEKAIKL